MFGLFIKEKIKCIIKICFYSFNKLCIYCQYFSNKILVCFIKQNCRGIGCETIDCPMWFLVLQKSVNYITIKLHFSYLFNCEAWHSMFYVFHIFFVFLLLKLLQYYTDQFFSKLITAIQHFYGIKFHNSQPYGAKVVLTFPLQGY